MFDANAGCISCGELFFAEVYETDTFLRSKGVKVGDIVLCSHSQKADHRNPTVTELWLQMDSESIEWHQDRRKEIIERDWSSLVYAGVPDGNGFLSSSSKQKALDFLNGEWLSGTKPPAAS